MAPLKHPQQAKPSISMSARDVQSSNLTSARFFGGVQKAWMTNPNQPVSRPGRPHPETCPSQGQGHRASNPKLREKSQSLSLDLAAAKPTEAYRHAGELLSPAAEVHAFPAERHSCTSTVSQRGDAAFSGALSSRPETAQPSPRTRSPITDRRQQGNQLVSSLPSPSPSLEHHEPLETQRFPDKGNFVIQRACNDITNDQTHSRIQLERSDAPHDQTGAPHLDPSAIVQGDTPGSPILRTDSARLTDRQNQAQTGGAFQGPPLNSAMSRMDSPSTSNQRQSPDVEERTRQFWMLQSRLPSGDGNRPLGSPTNLDYSQATTFNSALAKQVCDRVQVISQSPGRGEIEIKRLRLLEEACLKWDIEYLMMHQLFCWTHVNGSLMHCVYLTGTTPIHDRGLTILPQLLASNDAIPRDGVEWFSTFPKPLTHDESKTPELLQFERTLLRVLECMANRWSDLQAAFTTRRLPPSMGDISSVLGIRSPIIQHTVLRMVLRTLWSGDHDACLQQCEEMFSRAQSSFLFSAQSDLANAQALKAQYSHILARHAQHKERDSISREATAVSGDYNVTRQTQPLPSQRNPQAFNNFHPAPHRHVLASQSPMQSSNITVSPNAQPFLAHGTSFPAHLAHYPVSTALPRSSNNTNIQQPQLSRGLSRTAGNIHVHQSNSLLNGQAQNQWVQSPDSAVFSDRGQFTAPPEQSPFPQAQENVAQRFPGMEGVVGNRGPVRPPSQGDRQRRLFSPQQLPRILDPQASAMMSPQSPSPGLSSTNSVPAGAGFWFVPQSFNQGQSNNTNALQTHAISPSGQGRTGSLNAMGSPHPIIPSRPSSLPPSLPQSLPPSIPPSLPPTISSSLPPALPPSLPPSLIPSLGPSMSSSMPPPLLPTLPPGMRSNAKSPQLVPADSPDHIWRSRHFRFVTHTFMASTFLTKNSPFQCWSATLERQLVERRATEVPGLLGQPLRQVRNLSTVFRIRCIKSVGALGPPSESQWTVTETKWPENIAVSLNGINIDVRRRSQHSKDSPADVTALVQEGRNEIKAGVLGLQKKSDEQYLVGLEIVQVADHAHVKTLMSLLEIEYAKKRVLQRFHDADPDIRVIERVLDLTDPFTSRIFKVPSRGKDCLHDQCFDLDTFIDTRTSNESGQPCAPEAFRCPICKGDARPSSLIIDGFFLAIRIELVKHGRLDAKAIRIKRGGEWEIKEEEEVTGETGDGGSASASSGPAGRRSSMRGGNPAPAMPRRTNSEAAPIIILDD